MSQWHQSGTRRDICVLLYDAGEMRGQQLKTALSRHYERRLDPAKFYSVLDVLVDTGHVEKHEEGLQDVYSLTNVGATGIEEHLEWLCSQIEPANRNRSPTDDCSAHRNTER